MVKTFFFRGDMELEPIGNLLGNIESTLEDPGNSVRILVDSTGGDYSLLSLMLMTINENKNRIELVFSCCAHSSAFLLLLFASCEVKACYDLTCVTHLISMTINTESKSIPKHLGIGSVRMKSTDEENDSMCAMFLECGLHPEKVELVRNQMDVVVSREDALGLRWNVQKLMEMEGSATNSFMKRLYCI